MSESRLSAWLEEHPTASPETPQLAEDLDVEVAIIGGGYAGLSSALALAAEGAEVALLEARFCGFGASGRNAGHLTPTIGKDLPTLTLLYREPTVRALLELAERAIAHVEALIESHAIDCAYEATGNVLAAVCERQHGAIDKAARAAEAAGVPGELLDAAQMRRRGLPRAFSRGFLEPSGGLLDPGRYVRALRTAAIDAGVRVFEETPVRTLDLGSRVTLRTPRARVKARNLVLATNAFTGQLGLMQRRMANLGVQLFATAPLSTAQLARVGWQGREGIYTAHEMLESYRLTADNRVVGGAKHVRYRYGGAPSLDADPGIARRLEAVFRQRFPELSDVPVDSHWGGPIALALDFLPLVGRLPDHKNVLYALAFAGHGLAMASYAGVLIADLMHGRPSAGEVLWTRPAVPLPPEPLRWLLARSLTGAFGLIDAVADRLAARSGP